MVVRYQLLKLMCLCVTSDRLVMFLIFCFVIFKLKPFIIDSNYIELENRIS